MEVTSAHLDVIPYPEEGLDNQDSGEELSKRGEYFGHPVGKSTGSSFLSSPIWQPDTSQTNLELPPF